MEKRKYIGWLDPDGFFSSTDFPDGDKLHHHHQPVALFQIKLRYEDEYVSSVDPQQFLLSKGWLRLDINSILPRNVQPTYGQLDYLTELVIALNKGEMTDVGLQFKLDLLELVTRS